MFCGMNGIEEREVAEIATFTPDTSKATGLQEEEIKEL